MSRRIVEVKSLFFEWPVGATRPATYAILGVNLTRYLERTGAARIANQAESSAAVEANRAGPWDRKLSVDELTRCYRDVMGYEKFYASEGAPLLADERS
jgi:hypothetical protein